MLDKFLLRISMKNLMKIRQTVVKNFYREFNENATNSCKHFYIEFYENATNSCENFLHKILWKSDKFLWNISKTEFHENPTKSCEEFLYRISWKSDKFLWRISIQDFMKILQTSVVISQQAHAIPSALTNAFTFT